MRTRSNVFAIVAAVGALIVGITAPASADINPTGGDPETVTASPLTTYQTNGTVWTMEIVNGVTYVGGNFTSVRPSGSAPGVNTVDRYHLAAFNTATGDLLPWAPAARSTPFTPTGTPDKNCTALGGGPIECATVWSIKATPDKTKIVVAGDFQTIDGKVRAGIAAFTTATGVLDTTFKPATSGRIYSIAVTANTVYIGGSVTKAAGLTRTSLAAFSFPSGAVLPFAPTTTKGATTPGFNGVRSIGLNDSGTRLIIAGGFNFINSTYIHGLGAIDTTTGEVAPWQDKKIQNVAALTSLYIKDNVVYTTGDAAGSVNEGINAYDADTGAEIWYDSCRGASHSTIMVRGVMYAGSHSHNCGVATDGWQEQYASYPDGDRHRYKLRAEIPFSGDYAKGAKILNWFPDTDDGNGPRAMATDGDNLWIGGEFTLVDGVPQQGLTHFTFLDHGGVSHKPYTPKAPVVYSTEPGKVNITWKATSDPDNRDLEYWVIRDSVVKFPIAKITDSSKPWLQGYLSYTDTDVLPGESHTYDIRAVDPRGVQSVRSPGVTVTVATDATAAHGLPAAEGATAYYNFDTDSGSTYTDLIAARTATIGSRVSKSQPAFGSNGYSIGVNGSSRNVVIENSRAYTQRQYSLETMVKTNTNRGGVLLSLGDSNSTTGTSSNDVGVLYMSNDGRLNFGAREDVVRTDVWQNPSGTRVAVSTAASYNDNQWHHVAATFDPGNGLRIYVDGVLAASNSAFNWSYPYNAYLRIGGDSTTGFPNSPASSWFTGNLDEVAMYNYPLQPAQIARHSAGFLS